MKLTAKYLFPFAVALALLVAAMTGCTDKGTNDEFTGGGNIDLRARVNSSAAVQEVNLFVLTVTARDMDTVVDTLLFQDGKIVGEIEVPVGTDRKFVLEAYEVPVEGGLPVLIYKGVTITDVLPGSVVTLTIDLDPVLPMIRLNPRFKELESGKTFKVDIEVANIPNLAGAAVVLDMTAFDYAIHPINIVPYSTQNARVIVYGQSEFDDLRYRVITIDTLYGPIVDGDGNGILATVTFATEGFVGDQTIMGNIFIPEILLIDRNKDSIPTLGIQTDYTELVMTSTVDRIIQFPDATLLNYILTQVKKTTPPVYFSDVQYINYLDMAEIGVVDWTGLGELTNLRSLYLDWNNAPNLSPLSTLTGLTSLSVQGNNVVNVAPLGSLIGLQYLNLYWNDITSISGLSTLKGLTTLDVSSNNVSSLTPLAPLWRLNTLYLGSNQITDVTPLQGLQFLGYLDISYNNISDITPLLGNDGLGAGDTIDLTGNPLDAPAQQAVIDSLIARGASVYYGTK